MNLEQLNQDTDSDMHTAVQYMTQEFAGVRTGKASPQLVENIDVFVASYGSKMKLKQLAMTTTPEPRLLVVTPFDPSTLADIERGIRESKLGINPSPDGKVIRLPVPELSEERRIDLTKLIKKMAEDTRVRIRTCRKTAIDSLKQAEKNSEITEDDLHREEKNIQDCTDKHSKQIDEIVAKKEEEIMTI